MQLDRPIYASNRKLALQTFVVSQHKLEGKERVQELSNHDRMLGGCGEPEGVHFGRKVPDML